MKHLFAVLALLLPLALTAAAQNAPSLSERLEQWETDARAIEEALDADRHTLETIARARALLESDLLEVLPAREALQTRIAPLRDQLEALGEAPADPQTEAPQIATERQRLLAEIGEVEARLRRTDQAEARAEGLLVQLSEKRKTLFTDQLLSRGPSLLEAATLPAALASIQRTGRIIVLETLSRIDRQSTEMNVPRLVPLILPVVLIGVALAVLIKVRNVAIVRLQRSVNYDSPHSRRVAAGLGMTLARLLLPASAVALILVAVDASGLLGGQGKRLLEGLRSGAALLIGAYALGGAYYAPSAPALRLSRLGDRDARRAFRWLMILALVVGLDRALVVQGEGMGLAIEGLTLLNAALIGAGALALAAFAYYLRRPPATAEPDAPDAPAPARDPASPDPEDDPEEQRTRTAASSISLLSLLRLVAWLVALSAPVLALSGYYAGSRFLFYPLVFSGAVIGVCLLLFHVVRTIVDQIASSHDGDSAIDKLQLIPIGVALLLGCAAAPVLALIWGADAADLSEMLRMVASGFTVGEVRVSPVDFIAFVGVLVLGIVITRSLQRLLRQTVLPLTGMDAGGRDAITAGAGYLGIVAAALVAVSSAGLDLSNLAIVAGALSVGIGFGLQNIVNNFVSGVILLIERPIKAGDWIELPSGMGHVKNINVRSTEVETFDRASLFVPNSQLIAENVINWTHSNLNGRVIIQVGVAYGTDTRLVERILSEIARAHPMILRRPPPSVLFRSFDADSLAFEIRAILRDVNWKLSVQSDINHEIARRFTAEGIVIPFSQTDIHFQGAEEIGEAFGRGLGRARLANGSGMPQIGEGNDAPPDNRNGGPGRPNAGDDR
ncbi:MAG: DUF3772 domain-containing protein [Pseudomonadota bacterium]